MLEQIKTPNFILQADSYKAGHWEEIPAVVKKSYVAIVPRSTSTYSNKIVAAGQTIVAWVIANVRITEDMIDEAEREITEQGYNFNRKGWERIAREYAGKLPLAVYGVEEGRIVAPQTPILGLINTDDYSPWLPGYVESWAQAIVWSMSSVASTCRAARNIIKDYMELTGSDMSMLDYKLHNFGNRATHGPESMVTTGIAHAMLFLGSDCLEANSYIKKIYNTTKAYLSSVEATEHGTMCANSDAANKDDSGAARMAVRRLHAVVDRVKKAGIGIPLMSVVIDTYDSRRFVQQFIGKDLREEILASGGKLVCRPDSGDITVEPVQVALDLEAAFGVSINAAGYKVLNPAVGILQGDGVRVETIEPVLQAFERAKFSIDNIVLGMGYGVTNAPKRDDFSFSMKAVADFDGQTWKRLKKEPITDSGKNSLSGLVRCRENDAGELEVYDAMANGGIYNFEQETAGWKLYARDGFRNYRPTFDEVRARATA